MFESLLFFLLFLFLFFLYKYDMIYFFTVCTFVIQMLVIRGVPFPILVRPRVSVPLNSQPVAPLQKGWDHSPPKAFLEESSSFCF